MIRNRTAQIKPATRHAIMEQLALAADEIIDQRKTIALWQAWQSVIVAKYERMEKRRWWHRLTWWRA